jgi:hypothetical protein
MKINRLINYLKINLKNYYLAKVLNYYLQVSNFFYLHSILECPLTKKNYDYE